MAGIALCTMLLVAAAAGVLLGVTSPSARLYTFDVVAAITFTVLGGVVAPRQPGNPVGGLFVGIALASSVVVVSASYGDYGPMTWLNQWSPPVAYGLIPLVLLVFPDGRLPSARWRPVAYAAVGGTCLAAAGLAVAAWDVPGLLADLDAARTPLALAALRVARVGLIVVVISLVAAIASLVVRFRHSSGDTRQQLKWLAVGGACIPVAVAMDILGLAYVSDVLGAAAIPVASTAAILKYRLYDIDLFINRSLVYAILTLLVVGAYVAIVATLSTVLTDRAGWAPPVVAAAAVALALQPLRGRIQRRANRLLYGDRDDPYAVLSRLGRSLEQAGDPATVLSGVVEAVTEALQVPYAAIELTSPQGDRLAASHGRGGVIETERFPMTYQGRVVGTLLVSPRSSARPFSDAERKLLADLARQAGLAAHAVRLAKDLQRSRDRLVRSREEERRRLRRDLHDGLGPVLAGMTMQIGANRARQPDDDAPIAKVLSRLEEQLQGCVLEIRRLIDDLRPPALDDIGLVEGIRRQLDTFATGDGLAPEIGVHSPDPLEELPAAVEVAAYRIAIEAVTNAVRHAHANHCDVRITLGEALVVEVADDGIGIAADHPPGVGLASMRERAEELGGTLTAEPRPGAGTCIRAQLPLVAS